MIDPFNQMKREYDTILDNAVSANRNTFVPSQEYLDEEEDEAITELADEENDPRPRPSPRRRPSRRLVRSPPKIKFSSF